MKGLFIGLNTIDVQFLVDKYPHENQKTKANDYGLYSGGPATNAAITHAYLGGETRLLSSFGKHILTQLIFDELSHFNVATTDFTPDRTCHPVFASIVTTQTSGNRSIVSYHPENQEYCLDTLGDFSIADYDIVLTDTFYIDAVKTLLDKKERRPVVVMDGGSWKEGLDTLLPFVEIAICSADFHPPGILGTDNVVAYLRSKGIGKVVITHGDKPIFVQDEEETYQIPVEKINATDTLGAGDIFHGAFCYYYVREKNLKIALKKASEVAARSCLGYGTRTWMKN